MQARIQLLPNRILKDQRKNKLEKFINYQHHIAKKHCEYREGAIIKGY